MSRIIIDSSSIISLSMTCFLWAIKRLKEMSNTEFCITPFIKEEVVDRAVNSRRWHLEGLRVARMIDNGTFKVISNKKAREEAFKLMNQANKIFSARGENIKIIHKGEAELLALGNLLGSETMVIDEKTTRMLVEDYETLHNILGGKLKTEVKLNIKQLEEFRKAVGNKTVLRSVDVITICYEKGILNKLITKSVNKKELLKSSLWALKFAGCSVSEREIGGYVESARL